jgi:hypothetical protein
MGCEEYEPLVVGCVTMFYLGGACHLEILDHGEYPRWVTDCSDPSEVDEYCVYRNGGIGGAAVPAGDCTVTPVEGASWGAIKSLYR